MAVSHAHAMMAFLEMEPTAMTTEPVQRVNFATILNHIHIILLTPIHMDTAVGGWACHVAPVMDPGILYCNCVGYTL